MAEEHNNIEDFGWNDVSAVRRQSSAANAKGRPRRSAGRRLRKIVLVCLGVALPAVAAGFVARFALNDAQFRMAPVHLQGEKYLAAAEVEEVFAADKDQNLLRLPLERRRRQIEQIPWVRSATVRRIFPNQVSVTVSERVPVAFLAKDDGISLVDEDGVVLDAPKDAAFRFPVVHGLNENEPPAARREKMQLFAALMKDLQRGGVQGNDTISEVDLQDPQDARVVLSDSSGAVLVHLGRENFLARYLIYLSHIEEWQQKFPNLQSIDLRYEGQVVINADPQRDVKARQNSVPSVVPKRAARPQPPLTRGYD